MNVRKLPRSVTIYLLSVPKHDLSVIGNQILILRLPILITASIGLASKDYQRLLMRSTDSNYLIHWSLDTTESIRLKEGIITETLMYSRLNPYLIQFCIEAGNLLYCIFYCICWIAEFRRKQMLFWDMYFWNVDNFLEYYFPGWEKIPQTQSMEEGKSKQLKININVSIISVWIIKFCCHQGEIFSWVKKRKDLLK